MCYRRVFAMWKCCCMKHICLTKRKREKNRLNISLTRIGMHNCVLSQKNKRINRIKALQKYFIWLFDFNPAINIITITIIIIKYLRKEHSSETLTFCRYVLNVMDDDDSCFVCKECASNNKQTLRVIWNMDEEI